jgi:hypothetical protein
MLLLSRCACAGCCGNKPSCASVFAIRFFYCASYFLLVVSSLSVSCAVLT